MKKLTHIVCVDDEDDILEIVKMCLELGTEAKITCLSSGKQALTDLPNLEPDLVMLDVMMPQMDGPATLSALRATTELKSLPVIFMTARVRQSEVGEYLNLGAIGVVPKPFDPTTLAAEVIHIWESAQESRS